MIVFASRNEGKIREISSLLEDTRIAIRSLKDYSGIPDIDEDGETFFDNALKKARTISEFLGEPVLADDSGLEVDYLDGKPGVRSARYAGEDSSDEKNIQKLLQQLKGVPREKRRAAFRCSLVLYMPNGFFESFEGLLHGQITEEPVGEGGFGYDPVFLLPEKGVTVAQLSHELKNRISHRADAVNQFKRWLHNGNLPEEFLKSGRSAAR
jgi:XTP/dITP diphosphohydrolase